MVTTSGCTETRKLAMRDYSYTDSDLDAYDDFDSGMGSDSATQVGSDAGGEIEIDVPDDKVWIRFIVRCDLEKCTKARNLKIATCRGNLSCTAKNMIPESVVMNPSFNEYPLDRIFEAGQGPQLKIRKNWTAGNHVFEAYHDMNNVLFQYTAQPSDPKAVPVKATLVKGKLNVVEMTLQNKP